MGFIGKLIPSIIAGGLSFWIFTMLFENLYFQIIGSLVIIIIMYCIFSIIGKKKKKSTAKKDEPQTNETDEEDK